MIAAEPTRAAAITSWCGTHHECGRDVRSPLYANYGGPMSRTRTERVRSTLLGENDEFIRCPTRLRLALDFCGRDPWTCMNRLLRDSGLENPEELRGLYPDPPPPMLCVVNPKVVPLRIIDGRDPEILAQAFLLGLCTAVFYDPARPVIWTHASLTRRVELFDTGGFYA